MFYTNPDGSLDPARGFTEVAYEDVGYIVTRTNGRPNCDDEGPYNENEAPIRAFEGSRNRNEP
jgi:hypothetical protein